MKKREEADPKDCWKMEDMFPSDEAWEASFLKLKEEAEDFRSRKGTFAAGPREFYQALQKQDEIQLMIERVVVYASQRYHQDMGNRRYQEMAGRAQTAAAQATDALSFVSPEILEMGEEKIETFMKQLPELEHYRRMLEEELRVREHVLSPELETVMAKTQEMADSPQQIFMAFNNADAKFGTVADADGKEVPLTAGSYGVLMESKDRGVRKEAFRKLYRVYEDHKNMLSATFSANLKQAQFYAGMRHYGSALEAALDGGNIPVSVYDNLIAAVHEKLPAMYQYMELRKKLLHLEDLHLYDVYVPLVERPEKEIPFEEAKKIVKEGLSVLGEDYVRLLEEGFDNGWIDVYENQGKRSGAYSWGAYGTHPYVLLNYNGNLNAVFTLAHEMGHAIHSYYSDAAQPFTYAGYRIFVAEVASTCNEALLIHYLLEHAKDDGEKAYLINYFLDQFKSTLYRQTMFAEFEKLAHEEMAAKGSLSAEGLCEMYYELNRKYFGPGVEVDQEIAMEWARIPHFYTPFYVYQYATGFSAAIAISRKILNGEPGILEKYKRFLSGGSSMDPIDLLKICGVDMTAPEPVKDALEVFESYIRELERIS
ncbi:MAG: oligoendopeptidase F [Lachnospiraceae bacterium]|nr:oligoendopeptidase F [Lachnospiraceae bacterium]